MIDGSLCVLRLWPCGFQINFILIINENDIDKILLGDGKLIHNELLAIIYP